jgi:hypothetical protein
MCRYVSAVTSSPSTTRVVAVACPLAAFGLTLAAAALGGAWPRLAALAAAAGCLLLSVLLVRVDRQRRVDVAHVRAEQAAAYRTLHEERAAEHLEFTGHMVSIINERESVIAALRGRLDEVLKDLTRAREAVARAEARVRQAEDARRTAEYLTAEAEARLEEMVSWRSDVVVEDSECMTLPSPITDDEPLVEPEPTWAREPEVETAPPLRRTA